MNAYQPQGEEYEQKQLRVTATHNAYQPIGEEYEQLKLRSGFFDRDSGEKTSGQPQV